MCRRTFLLAVLAALVLPAGPIRAAAEDKRKLVALRRERLISQIRLVLGKPYVWGARGPSAFDCSGLIWWLYSRVGLSVPRTAKSQGKAGMRVLSAPVFGDVLLFRSRASPSGWHTGMYLGQAHFVHASGRKRGVVVSPLKSYAHRLVAVRRYLA